MKLKWWIYSIFAASFAADVPPDTAAFMADSQVPWGVEALGGKISEPAWKSKPSWYLVTTDDKMIPPDAQRAMSKRAGSKVEEVKASHSVFVSKPAAVAAIVDPLATLLRRLATDESAVAALPRAPLGAAPSPARTG